ncbi:hypothetical protein AMTRI_Chr13g119000 [Amborella trichopoda]
MIKPKTVLFPLYFHMLSPDHHQTNFFITPNLVSISSLPMGGNDPRGRPYPDSDTGSKLDRLYPNPNLRPKHYLGPGLGLGPGPCPGPTLHFPITRTHGPTLHFPITRTQPVAIPIIPIINRYLSIIHKLY